MVNRWFCPPPKWIRQIPPCGDVRSDIVQAAPFGAVPGLVQDCVTPPGPDTVMVAGDPAAPCFVNVTSRFSPASTYAYSDCAWLITIVLGLSLARLGAAGNRTATSAVAAHSRTA